MPRMQKTGHFAKVCRTEHQNQQENKELTESEDTEESDTDKSINIITEKKPRNRAKKSHYHYSKNWRNRRIYCEFQITEYNKSTGWRKFEKTRKYHRDQKDIRTLRKTKWNFPERLRKKPKVEELETTRQCLLPNEKTRSSVSIGYENWIGRYELLEVRRRQPTNQKKTKYSQT